MSRSKANDGNCLKLPLEWPYADARMGEMKAIDLYSGVGGWSLGLRMAGIEVIRSYEWWDSAARTHRANLDSHVDELDIRQLDPRDVPDVDIVVGSPPCTQFSFSNRGGNGDIADGLRDIAKFLEIVEHVNPAYWAMENVPRVAGILRRELKPGGSLRPYAGLVDVIEVVDMSTLGLPQRRRRMIAGRFPVELLDAYREHLPARSLGDVLDALTDDPVRDPIYDLKLAGDEVSDHVPEEPLNDEEERMNREAKSFHPVYNRMAFPDITERASRTVTAVCTRVSRESIIIQDPQHPGSYRRLTLRERAVLQGFPITYQFFGDSYTDKLKLVGNALPPLAAYYIGHAMLGTQPDDVVEPALIAFGHTQPPERPTETSPPKLANSYPLTRKFRAAIPNLRFGSGMRVQLANESTKWGISWDAAFYFGSSKEFRALELNEEVMAACLAELDGARDAVRAVIGAHEGFWKRAEPADVQAAWTHRDEDAIHPFKLVDDLGDAAEKIYGIIREIAVDDVLEAILDVTPGVRNGQTPKFRDHAHWIMAGIIVGAAFNMAQSNQRAR